MLVTIIAVHPEVTIVQFNDRRAEVPTAWFPHRPQAEQTWEMEWRHRPNEEERLASLNSLLARATKKTNP